MTDYYMDEGGSNTSPYDTWAKAATSLSTVTALASANDTIHARSTHTISADIAQTNSGTSTTGFIKLIGYNASGVNDGTFFTIDCNAGAYSFLCSKNFWQFENIRITNGTTNGFEGAAFPVANIFNHCQADNLTGMGWELGPKQSLFIRCLAYNCSNGFAANDVNSYLFCSARDNSIDGFDLDFAFGCTVVGCISHGNSVEGINDSDVGANLILNCIVDGNETHGIKFDSSAPSWIIGNRITNQNGSGDIGIDFNSKACIRAWNYYQDNDGANIRNATYASELLNDGATTEQEDQGDTDEGYTNVTPGSEDFNLESDATARNQSIAIPF